MKVASGNVLWRQRKRNWCRTPFTFTVYMLTDQEMSIKTGILNEKFNLIKYSASWILVWSARSCSACSV